MSTPSLSTRGFTLGSAAVMGAAWQESVARRLDERARRGDDPFAPRTWEPRDAVEFLAYGNGAVEIDIEAELPDAVMRDAWLSLMCGEAARLHLRWLRESMHDAAGDAQDRRFLTRSIP